MENVYKQRKLLNEVISSEPNVNRNI